MNSESPEFLLFSDTVTQGEELAAICRVPEGQPLPASVTVTATLNRKPWIQTVPVANVKDQATYLPRHWAKLEINRLLADNAEQHREAIVALSKSMYVMSPFTSLLVLENEEMYTQFNIDRGRKDHWALYPCPEQIEVAVENTDKAAATEGIATGGPETSADVMSTITRIQRPQWFTWNMPAILLGDGSKRDAVPQSGVEANGRLPQAKYLNYFMYQGTSDFGLRTGNGSLNHWGRTQQQGNSWFEDHADSYWLDSDNNGDGIREGIWNELSTSLWDLNLHGNADWYFHRNLGRDGSTADFDRPSSESVVNTTEEAEFQRVLGFNEAVRERKTDSFTPQLNDVEFSSTVPTGDYSRPDATTWRELVERRKKYDQANNRDRTESERQIEAGLSQMVSLHFHDAPLTSVVRHIANVHGINIAIKTNAIETKGLAVNPLVDIDVDGITLKSALNLLLDQAGGLAYSIENDTLMITTGEEVRRGFRTENLSRGGIRLVSPEQPEVRITGQNSVGSHRWSADSAGAGTEFVGLPTFQTPPTHSLGVNASLFGDVISHAPGLNTSPADVLAVVEAESVAKISNFKFQISNPPAGRVDDAARSLIEKSRSRGWESITLPGREGEPGITIHYDGSGRHVWERIVSEGLREHVVCDGTTLWHVYREIGLASRRPFSGFHHRAFAAIVPWLLPSADELARAANVVAVDERTIAIVPNSVSPVSGGRQPSCTTATECEESPAASALPLTLHLVFAPDGRLAERRIVKNTSGKILHRVTYDANGTIRILEADGKEPATLNLHRSTAAAPQLVPDLDGLVVLPMPVRTPEVIVAKKNAAVDQVGQQDADLSEDDAVSLMLAYMANGNGARMVEIARKRFIEKGDTRDGIYVLLSRFPHALVQGAIPADATPGSVQTPGFDLRPPVEGSPLKQFVRSRLNTPELLAAYSKAAERFEQHPQLGLLVRRERMTALFAAGRHDEGRCLFREWLIANLEQGFVPPIGTELYNACISHNGQKQIDELLLEAVKRLVDAHMLMTLHSMSVQMRELGNTNVANQMMTLLLASLDEDDTAACQTASRLLAKLNSRVLARDYLATPLAENSGESAPWIALARSLGTDTQTDLADMAWTHAFELESTNPEILLEHARLLQTTGRLDRAKALLKRAIDGTWQPRFASTVQQCRDLLRSL